MLQKRVGMRIREIRERWGMSQEELAKRLNVSVSAVKTWENGLGYPSIENCVGLTQVFHISSDYFFAPKAHRVISLDHLTDFQLKMMYNVLDFIEQNREYKRKALGIKKKPVYIPKGEDGRVNENKEVSEDMSEEVIEDMSEEVNEDMNEEVIEEVNEAVNEDEE